MTAEQQARHALLVVNMGGPADESEVRDYLRAIFADPWILSMPSMFRLPLGSLLVSLRTQKVIDKYSIIGGGSPLHAWTVSQVNNMQKSLNENNRKFSSISYAFRYSAPTIRDSITSLKSKGIERVTLLPLFPHYTGPMTGSIFEEARKVVREMSLTLTEIPVWGQHNAILNLQKEYLAQAIEKVGEDAKVLFVAHGIPMSNVKRGDDYPQQVEASARTLGKSLPNGTTWSLAYQSKVGPVKWTTPYLEDELDRLLKSNRPLVIMPLSFVADCLETLYDLDIIAARQIRDAGVDKFIRVPVFNDDLRFAEAMMEIVNETTI